MKISASRIASFLTIGENLNIEFKKASDGPKADTFESVCAFLNKAGGEGFKAAAVLLLGSDDCIGDVFPAYKTDALLRRVNVERYDDRDTVSTNLLDSYDRLCAFGEKHLLDKFYLEDDKRVSLRNKILREMIGNLLIHREFSSARYARFIIERDRMYTENANRAFRYGRITPKNLEPEPKNPIIADFFHQVRLADELGSGVRNLFHYGKIYSGADPVFDEDDVFRIIVPLNDEYSADREIDKALPSGTTTKTDQETNRETNRETNGETNREDRLKKLIEDNPTLTITQLSSLSGLSYEGVRYHLRTLSMTCGLRHEGPTKKGRWVFDAVAIKNDCGMVKKGKAAK